MSGLSFPTGHEICDPLCQSVGRLGDSNGREEDGGDSCGCFTMCLFTDKEDARINVGQPKSSPRVSSLNGLWHFRLFDCAENALHFVASASREQFSMEPVHVPGSWQLQAAGDAPIYTNIKYIIPVKPPNIPKHNPTGYYRRTVPMNRRKGGHERLILSFGGVDSAFYLFINHQYAGLSKDSRLAADFDITDYLILTNRGSVNEIDDFLVEVVVVRYSDAHYLEDQDMFNLSGIFRDVFLYRVPGELSIRDFHWSTVRTETGDVLVDVEVRLLSYPPLLVEGPSSPLHPTAGVASGVGSYQLQAELFQEGVMTKTTYLTQAMVGRNTDAGPGADPGASTSVAASKVSNSYSTSDPTFPTLLFEDAVASPICTETVPVTAPEGTRASSIPIISTIHIGMRVPAEKVQLWSAEAPYLYTITVCLQPSLPSPPRQPLSTSVSSLRQVESCRMGIRTVSIDNGILSLNSRALTIRGANLHEHCPIFGHTITPQLLEADILILKRHNFNAVRTSHYPQQPWFYELCNAYGLYVVDEANIETHGMRPYCGRLADDPAWADAHIVRLSRLLKRDRRHCCVLGWSLGNEAGYGTVHARMADYARTFDRTRYICYEPASYGTVESGFEWNATQPPSSATVTAAKNVGAYNNNNDMSGGSNREANWSMSGNTGATDVVCPMYAHVDECIRLSTRFPHMPVIHCEYAHMMGNSGGNFFKYWQDLYNSDKYPRVQGGFIWDWVDQGLSITTSAKQCTWVYGGDFGELSHDSNFCVNGLLWPDRGLDLRNIYPQRQLPYVHVRAVGAGTGTRFAADVDADAVGIVDGCDDDKGSLAAGAVRCYQKYGPANTYNSSYWDNIPHTDSTSNSSNDIKNSSNRGDIVATNRDLDDICALKNPHIYYGLTAAGNSSKWREDEEEEEENPVLQTVRKIVAKPPLLEVKQCMKYFDAKVVSVNVKLSESAMQAAAAFSYEVQLQLDIENRFIHTDSVFTLLRFRALLLYNGLIVAVAPVTPVAPTTATSPDTSTSTAAAENTNTPSQNATLATSTTTIPSSGSNGSNSTENAKAVVTFHWPIYSADTYEELLLPRNNTGIPTYSNTCTSTSTCSRYLVVGSAWSPTLLSSSSAFYKCMAEVNTIAPKLSQSARSSNNNSNNSNSSNSNSSSSSSSSNGTEDTTSRIAESVLWSYLDHNLSPSSANHQFSVVIVAATASEQSWAEAGYPVGFAQSDLIAASSSSSPPSLSSSTSSSSSSLPANDATNSATLADPAPWLTLLPPPPPPPIAGSNTTAATSTGSTTASIGSGSCPPEQRLPKEAPVASAKQEEEEEEEVEIVWGSETVELRRKSTSSIQSGSTSSSRTNTGTSGEGNRDNTRVQISRSTGLLQQLSHAGVPYLFDGNPSSHSSSSSTASSSMQFQLHRAPTDNDRTGYLAMWSAVGLDALTPWTYTTGTGATLGDEKHRNVSSSPSPASGAAAVMVDIVEVPAPVPSSKGRSTAMDADTSTEKVSSGSRSVRCRWWMRPTAPITPSQRMQMYYLQIFNDFLLLSASDADADAGADGASGNESEGQEGQDWTEMYLEFASVAEESFIHLLAMEHRLGRISCDIYEVDTLATATGAGTGAGTGSAGPQAQQQQSAEKKKKKNQQRKRVVRVWKPWCYLNTTTPFGEYVIGGAFGVEFTGPIRSSSSSSNGSTTAESSSISSAGDTAADAATSTIQQQVQARLQQEQQALYTVDKTDAAKYIPSADDIGAVDTIPAYESANIWEARVKQRSRCLQQPQQLRLRLRLHVLLAVVLRAKQAAQLDVKVGYEVVYTLSSSSSSSSSHRGGLTIDTTILAPTAATTTIASTLSPTPEQQQQKGSIPGDDSRSSSSDDNGTHATVVLTASQSHLQSPLLSLLSSAPPVISVLQLVPLARIGMQLKLNLFPATATAAATTATTTAITGNTTAKYHNDDGTAVMWCGCGPQESYADRKHACVTAVHNTTLTASTTNTITTTASTSNSGGGGGGEEDRGDGDCCISTLHVPYVRPGENGARSDVTWVQFTPPPAAAAGVVVGRAVDGAVDGGGGGGGRGIQQVVGVNSKPFPSASASASASVRALRISHARLLPTGTGTGGNDNNSGSANSMDTTAVAVAATSTSTSNPGYNQPPPQRHATTTPFHFSAQRYDTKDLATSMHVHEILEHPRPYTCVNVDSYLMGVGGDDSWSACVHKEYTQQLHLPPPPSSSSSSSSSFSLSSNEQNGDANEAFSLYQYEITFSFL